MVDKSNQGKYAASMRQTIGRTGSRGENGVRELLRERFNRSPDPDEMEYELTRDKGYGGYKKWRSIVKQEKETQKLESEENSLESHSDTNSSERSESECGDDVAGDQTNRATNKVRGVWKLCSWSRI